MCAVEKVSATNGGGENQNAEILEKTWSNLPGRALKGTWDGLKSAPYGLYNAGKYATDSIYNVGKGASDGLYNVGKYAYGGLKSASDGLYNVGKYAWENMFAKPRENERSYRDPYGEKRELRPLARVDYNRVHYIQ